MVFIGAIMLLIDFEAMWMYALSAMIVGIILHVIASLVVKKPSLYYAEWVSITMNTRVMIRN
ncbi:hypothetical protein [Thalassobacillus sp. C254]|uniref:hypothetical protein n=1 Tax=Thalassobacillus sp. C254 TaxID=1225341 RepID=UPI0018DBB653|nr:hypothetical protein [Thalassobacillus sp. C254]